MAWLSRGDVGSARVGQDGPETSSEGRGAHQGDSSLRAARDRLLRCGSRIDGVRGMGDRRTRVRSARSGSHRTKEVWVPASPPVVTLTTDFGTDDWYAGALRGAVL